MCNFQHSTVDGDGLYGDHFTDIRPSPRKGEGQKKQVLPKEVRNHLLWYLQYILTADISRRNKRV